MDVISSPYTAIRKWLTTTVWMGLWSVIGVAGVVRRLPEPAIVSVFMLLIGYFACSRLYWCLADEVLDLGTYLRVRRGSTWEHIDLSGIERVSYLAGAKSNLPRVVLRLRKPCVFGSVVRFVPRIDFWGGLSAGREVADELERRVKDEHRKKLAAYCDQARQAHSSGQDAPGA